MADKNLRVSIVLRMAEKVLGPLKNISQGSSETAQTLKAARDQLKQLDATQKSVGAFREARAGLESMEAQLKAAREKVRGLAQSYGQAGPPTKQMAAAMAAARAEASQLGAQFNVQQQKVQQLRDKLAAAGISTKNLAEHDRQLRASVSATRTDIEKQTQALKLQADMQRRVAGIKQAQDANVAARGQARGALLDGVALAATLGAPIKMAMDWEQRLAELNKVANKTPQELQAIADASQRLAVETGVAREEIIGAYIAASQAGFAESEWAKFAEVSAKMGVAFDTTGEKAGDMLKAWRAGMNLSMDQAAALAGAVNHIANSMNATALDIGGVMRRQGAYLSAMGLNQTQSAALAATMLSGGATEEIAATASKNFMKAMTVGFAATKSQQQVFGMLDVDPEKLAKQMQKAPEKAIVDVMKRLQKLAPDQLAPAMKMLFGDESIGPAAQIVKSVDGLVAAFEMVDDQAKYITSLQDEFDSMGNTTQQQMKKASEGVKTVVTALGAGLLPAINQTMAAFAPVALAFSGWMQANQGLVTSVVMVVAVLMALKIATIAGAYVFTFVRGAMLSVQAVLMACRMGWMLYTGAIVASSATSKAAMAVSKGLAAAQWLVNAAMSANPIGLLIIAITALIGAGILLWRNWDQVVAGAKLLWQDLGGFLSGLWGSIASTATAAWSGMVQQFKQFGGWIVDGVIGGITAKLGALKDAVVGAASSAAKWFKEKLGIARPSKVFMQFGGWVSEGAAKGIDAGQAGVRAAALGLAAVTAAPMHAQTVDLPQAQVQLLNAAQQIQVPKAAVDLANAQQSVAVPQASVQLLNAAQQIQVPKAVAELVQGKPQDTDVASSPGQPRLAQPARIAAAPRAAAAAPVAAGPSTYNITINAAPGADAQAIARAVAAELDRRERQASARRKSSLHDLS